MATMRFDLLAEGLAYSEGPLALGDGGLLCVQVLAGRLSRLAETGAIIAGWELGGGPNGLAFGPDEKIFVCNNGGLSEADIARMRAGGRYEADDPGLGEIQVIDLKTGIFSTLYDRCGGVALTAPNDLVFDKFGGFYFTDFGSLRQLKAQPGAVYYAQADGSAIHAIDRPFERPNGVGLSPDGNTLYVSETNSGRVWKFDLEAPGKLTPATADELLHEDPGIMLDSLAVQANGKVCVASPFNNMILRVAADGASEQISTGDVDPSNLCFGGPDNATAYLTGLHTGKILVARWDEAGLRLPFQPEPGARSFVG